MESIIISLPKLRKATFAIFINGRLLPSVCDGLTFSGFYVGEQDNAFYFAALDSQKTIVHCHRIDIGHPEMDCGSVDTWAAIWHKHWYRFCEDLRLKHNVGI